MKLYKRDISFKRSALHFLFILLIIFSIISIKNSSELVYLTSVLLIFSSLITVTGIAVSKEYISVDRYFFFGIIKKNMTIKEVRLFRNFEHESFADGGSDAGCLISLLTIFVNWKYQWMEATFIEKSNAKNRWRIKLTDEELLLISKTFNTEIEQAFLIKQDHPEIKNPP